MNVQIHACEETPVASGVVNWMGCRSHYRPNCKLNTVGFATTKVCYNEQFISLKSECYNEQFISIKSECYNEQFISIKSECYNEQFISIKSECYNERGGILFIKES